MTQRKITSLFGNLVVIFVVFWIFCLMHLEYSNLHNGRNATSSENLKKRALKLIVKEETVPVDSNKVFTSAINQDAPAHKRRILRIWVENPAMKEIRYHQMEDEEDDDPSPKPKLLNATFLDANDSTWDPEGLIRKLDTPSDNCRKLVSFGGKVSCGAKDGHKIICFDPDVVPLVRVNQHNKQALSLKHGTDQLQKNKTVLTKTEKVIDADEDPSDFFSLFKFRRAKENPCLVYSFGISTDMTFDEAMAKFGCKTYSYDMTIINTTSRHVQTNLNYLNIGIDAENHDLEMTMMPSKTQLRSSVRTLGEIREILNQEDMNLDIFKLDIEYAEWHVLGALVNSDEGRDILRKVNQIALEIHLDGMTNESESVRVQHGQEYEKVVDGLSDLGFKMVYTFLNEFSQKYALLRGKVLPMFRESLFIRRP